MILRRARSRSPHPVGWLALPLLSCLSAAPLAAQVVQDTVPADTLEAPAPREVRLFPILPAAGPIAGAARGVWIWDRDALLREMPVTLIDLLNRIPGIAAFRAGMFVQPEAATAFGGTAGRVEVELDGYPLVPLGGSTLDLAAIPLGPMREVRVERRLGLLRIRLLSDQPVEPQPVSRVEAGIGQPPANMFRGVLLVPHVIAGPFGAAIERLDTDGFRRNEPANVFSTWLKWGWTSGGRGIQAELLRSSIRREPNSPWPGRDSRQDLLVRGRNTFADGFVGEAFAGVSSFETEPEPASTTDTVPPIERDATQFGARLAFEREFVALEGSFRYRDHDRLPRAEARLDARLARGPALLSASLDRASFAAADAATSYALLAQATAPFGGSLFVELAGGRRGAPDYRGDELHHVITDRDGWRAGAALAIGQRASGSIALLQLDQDHARPFGLPFDSAHGPGFVETARGVEASGRFLIAPGWLSIESWITDWSQARGWTYLPVRSWRTALELHTSPLPSGNLEILGRFEGTQRSGMLAFNPEPPPAEPEDDPEYSPFVQLRGFTRFHAYLQIRVIDVRIFLRYEDLLGNDVEDLPGRFHRGPRIFYGVKWTLRN